MCTTASLGALGMGMQVGGGIYSAIGAYSQARGTRYGFEQNATIAEANAAAISAAADATEQFERADVYARGATEEQRLMAAGSQVRGRARAALGASGVRLDEGSALRLLTDVDVGIAEDAALIRENVSREAAGVRLKAARMRVDAESVRLGGQSYQGAAGAINPGASAFGSLLGSATSVASNWYQYAQRRGAPGRW